VSSISQPGEGSSEKGNPQVFLTVPEAAGLLRLSVVTLGRWRTEGFGPPYRKFGRRVLYDRSDLIAWANAQARSSTSDQRT
jgi:hypothetical protein